jgi:hypothetical protein
VLLTSIAMYAAIWHRGRQSLGIARFYQRQAGGRISPLHSRLFGGAIYMPMVAAIFLYGYLAPENYEGEPYYTISAGVEIAWGLGLFAFSWVVAYLVWTCIQNCQDRESNIKHAQPIQTLHPGERWVVVAHAVAFGSASCSVPECVVSFGLGCPSRCNTSISLTPWRVITRWWWNFLGDLTLIRGPLLRALAFDRSCRSGRCRLVSIRVARSAGSGWTFLPLLARWSDLDKTFNGRLIR